MLLLYEINLRKYVTITSKGMTIKRDRLGKLVGYQVAFSPNPTKRARNKNKTKDLNICGFNSL